MGGGPEIPQRGSRGERELLLITHPQKEEELAPILDQIKEEFPNLDTHFVEVGFGKDVDVPKGNFLYAHWQFSHLTCLAFVCSLIRFAMMIHHIQSLAHRFMQKSTVARTTCQPLRGCLRLQTMRPISNLSSSYPLV